MNRYFAWFGQPGAFVLTLLLSLFALIMALRRPQLDRWLCFIAMAFSSIGDIFLMRYGGLQRYFPNYFVIGAASFAVAHLFYAAAYRTLARRKGHSFLNGGVVPAALLAVGCAVYFTRICIRRNDFGDYPLCMAYLVVIALNCAVVLSYAWAEFRKRPVAILAAAGALSFLISDLFIGLGVLAGNYRFDHLIWWYYPIGQILLIAFEE